MRPAVALLLCLAACAVEPTGADPVYASVTGALERLDPDDSSSPWVGIEVIEVTDDVGSCAITREIDAVEASAGCDGCALVLDVTVHRLGEVGSCAADLTATPILGPAVGFRDAEVLVGDGAGWEPYSDGVLEVDVMTWHHLQRVPRSGDASREDLDVRDLHEPPIVR